MITWMNSYRSTPYIINFFDNIISNNIKKLNKNITSSKNKNGLLLYLNQQIALNSVCSELPMMNNKYKERHDFVISELKEM